MENLKKQSLKKNQPVKEEEGEDPFIALKNIAYHRTTLGPLDKIESDQEILDFAKWQICKARNVLFLDPIWDDYTAEDIMVEFFTIQFDESEDLREAFKLKIQGKTKPQYEWFDQMEAKYQKDKEKEVKDMGGDDEISEKF